MAHWTEHLTENVFTWQDPDTEDELTFATDRMGPWCKDNAEVYATPVRTEDARVFLRERGIERHRIDRLTTEALNTPIIYCTMDGGTHLLVDGHHRYVYAAVSGHRQIPAYILTREQWEPFLVTGIPKQGYESLTTRFSGIE